MTASIRYRCCNGRREDNHEMNDMVRMQGIPMKVYKKIPGLFSPIFALLLAFNSRVRLLPCSCRSIAAMGL